MIFTDIEYIKIDFEKLKNVMYSNPDLSLKIQASLIKKIKNLEHVISSNLVLDAKTRVAKYIFENQQDFFRQKNIEISEVLNITPETLSRILKEFKKFKVLDVKNRTIDNEKLVQYYKFNIV